MNLRNPTLALLLVLGTSCMTETIYTRTWSVPPPPPPERFGGVAWVRETVRRQEGNPVGGAAVGAIVGGVLGHAITGAPAGAVLGGAGGAAVGAAASQGSAETRTYEVAVRFDDGAEQVFVFSGSSPFWAGERVVLSPAGLRHAPARPPTAAQAP
jgi:outer membrane lipoprotein SlyB